MENDLLTQVEQFRDASGLSDHRVGIVLAKNGRLLERLREGKRIWPDTEDAIRASITREAQVRGIAPAQVAS